MKKLKAKGRAILRAAEDTKAPDFNILDYRLSLMQCLNYYNNSVDEKKKQAYAISYWKKEGKNVKGLDKVSASYFCQAGALAHMLQHNMPLDNDAKKYLKKKYLELIEKVPKTQAAAATPKPTVQDRIDEIASVHIAEFKAAFDDTCFNGSSFNPKEYLTKNQISAPIAKRISDAFKPQLKELQEALLGKDEQLKEGYSNFGKRGLKTLVETVSEYVTACDNMAVIARTMRKPTVRKPRPPSKIVTRLKYMKEFGALKMKSISPEKIVGANQVWIYNTKLRKLFKYEALEGTELTVQGTTLRSFDPAKSGCKMIRKPEVTLAGVGSLTKRPINNLYNEIKAVAGKATGRVSDDYIIVGAFI